MEQSKDFGDLCWDIYDINWKSMEELIVGTVIVLAVVAAAVILAVRSMIKDKKAGKSLQCGGDCSQCGGCH